MANVSPLREACSVAASQLDFPSNGIGGPEQEPLQLVTGPISLDNRHLWLIRPEGSEPEALTLRGYMHSGIPRLGTIAIFGPEDEVRKYARDDQMRPAEVTHGFVVRNLRGEDEEQKAQEIAKTRGLSSIYRAQAVELAVRPADWRTGSFLKAIGQASIFMPNL